MSPGPLRAVIVLLACQGIVPTRTLAQATAARGTTADSLEAVLVAAESSHRRGRFAEAKQAIAVAAAMAASAAEQARVWLAGGTILISQTTAANEGYAEADSASGRALEAAERSGDPGLRAGAYDLAGRLHYSRRINLGDGDYDVPLGLFRRALELRRGAGDTRGVVESLFRIGLIHERRGEDAEAAAVYRQAMRLAGKDHPLERSNLARHLGYHHRARGELDQALALFEQSLALRDTSGFELTRAPALASLADLHRERKDHAKALEYGRRALAEATRLGAPRFEVIALLSIGDTYAATAQPDSARAQFRRAELRASEIAYVSGVRQARERLSRDDSR
jgi:tetratricopeptide (TPR) repeat protein